MVFSLACMDMCPSAEEFICAFANGPQQTSFVQSAAFTDIYGMDLL